MLIFKFALANKENISFAFLYVLSYIHAFIVDCGSNVIIPNGHVDFTGLPTTYGQYVPVICDQGYTRQGGTHVQCLSDGVWSRTVICEIVGMDLK